MSGIMTKLKDAYVSFRGFHTKRKIVVIESDDWGSIRTPSQNTLTSLASLGDDPEKDPFLRYDCLEGTDDLKALYKALSSVKDSKGRGAVMTANFAVANPDFDNIDVANGKYAFVPFYQSYKEKYPDSDVLSVIKEGIKLGVFCPQLHCREHMNVARWMKALSDGKSDALLAFRHRMIGVGASFSQDNPYGYMDSFNNDVAKNDDLADILKEAARIFADTFGYKSESFVASCFVLDPALLKPLSEVGVRCIQTNCWQSVPVSENGSFALKRSIRYTGKPTAYGQVYSVRNCSFEPSVTGDAQKAVSDCLEEIRYSFKHKKPAVINTHRLNYMSGIKKENGEANIAALCKLLQSITSEFEDVEFLSTTELCDLMLGRDNG